MRAKTEDLRAATIVQARSGCPPTGTRFLRGIPLEPPLAGMKPRTLGRAFAVATPESREGPATMRLDRASPAQLHRTAQLRAQARVFLLPHGEFSPARYTWQIFSQCCLSQSCRVHARLDCRIYATTLRAYSGLCRSLALPKVGSGLPIKNRGCRRARGRRCRARASIATTAPSERCHRGSGEEMPHYPDASESFERGRHSEQRAHCEDGQHDQVYRPTTRQSSTHPGEGPVVLPQGLGS